MTTRAQISAPERSKHSSIMGHPVGFALNASVQSLPRPSVMDRVPVDWGGSQVNELAWPSSWESSGLQARDFQPNRRFSKTWRRGLPGAS